MTEFLKAHVDGQPVLIRKDLIESVSTSKKPKGTLILIQASESRFIVDESVDDIEAQIGEDAVIIVAND